MNIPNWIMAHGDDLQFILFFALLAGLTVFEFWVPKRPGPMQRRSRWTTNYLLTAINIVAMGFLPVSFVSASIWAQSSGIGLLNWIAMPLTVVVMITLLVRGFISFFTHYLNHMVPAFWRVHRVHHLDTELDVSTTVRFHPLEFVIGLLLGLPLIVLFGPSPWVLAGYELLDVVVTLWSHSNIRVPAAIDRRLRYVIVTPDLHRVHHSAWKPETNSNYGAVFPIWDLVFGTFRDTPRDGHEHMQLGLEDVRGTDAQRPLWLLRSVARRELRS